MTTAMDLVEDWIQMRSTLARQLALLKAGKMPPLDNVADTTTRATITQIEKWMTELNTLLKAYSRV